MLHFLAHHERSHFRRLLRTCSSLLSFLANIYVKGNLSARLDLDSFPAIISRAAYSFLSAQTSEMAPFDPFTQNVTFLGPDGKTKLHVPMPAIDALNDESVSISINYGCQLGACVIMLLTVLVMTPWSKLGRPSNILHILGLVVCIIRMGILCAYFTSPFNDFYAYWAVDYSRVAARYYQASIVGTVFSLLLVIIVELALMNQAWTMVVLWPKRYKWPLAILSLLITLLTVGWRIAFTVIQCESVVSVKPPSNYYWGIYWMMVTNIMSICWFCAIFNVKLIIHLVTNRGILPSSGTLTPMEVLVMTNGLLMVVPGESELSPGFECSLRS